MNRISGLSAAVLLCSALNLQAAESRVIDGDGRCYAHEYQNGEIVRLKIATFADLRIEMPFPIYTAKLGGGQLWQATFTRGVRHIWIKSKTEAEQGAVTSLTVLDAQLNAYDFVIQRVSEPGYICAQISQSQDDFFLQDLNSYRSPEQQEVEALRAQLLRTQEQYQADLEMVREHAENVISASQSSIYAGYTWKAAGRGTGSAKVAAAISSVHDDGLLTFINVSDITVGVLSIQGSFAGQTQIVQVDYNPLLAMYTITGVFDTLVVTGEQGSVEITRGVR
ncbi:MAG: hypothetical protein Q8K97_17730 [Pseudohongiella sp.]|nr:hypothetical protein [Pseudohongiella sp.]